MMTRLEHLARHLSLARGGVRDRSYNRKRTTQSAPQETPCPPPSTCLARCNT